MYIKNSKLNKHKTIQNRFELHETAREVLAAGELYRWVWRDAGTPHSKRTVPLLELQLDKMKVKFAVAFHLAPTARDIEHLAVRSSPYPPLLVAPALSELLVAHCRKHRVNCLDLNGRQWIRIKGVVIDRQPLDAPRYRPSLFPLNPFQPKSSRLPRLLLAERDRTWTQKELIEATGLSPGLISRMVRQFVNEGVLSQDHRLVKLSQFDALLDQWRQEDQWTKRTTIRQYSTLIADFTDLARKVQQSYSNKSLAFTQWFAASLRYPYTTSPVVSAYVPMFPGPEFEREILGRQVFDGGTLWLIIPHDEGVFQTTQKVNDFNLVCDVQIYLDLQSVGLRGPDQAKALRDWKGFGKGQL